MSKVSFRERKSLPNVVPALTLPGSPVAGSKHSGNEAAATQEAEQERQIPDPRFLHPSAVSSHLYLVGLVQSFILLCIP